MSPESTSLRVELRSEWTEKGDPVRRYELHLQAGAGSGQDKNGQDNGIIVNKAGLSPKFFNSIHF